jgi:putative hemolysin
MNNVILEILFIFFLAIINGVLAMSEIAIVSSRKVRLRQYAVDGDHDSSNDEWTSSFPFVPYH